MGVGELCRVSLVGGFRVWGSCKSEDVVTSEDVVACVFIKRCTGELFVGSTLSTVVIGCLGSLVLVYAD